MDGVGQDAEGGGAAGVGGPGQTTAAQDVGDSVDLSHDPDRVGRIHPGIDGFHAVCIGLTGPDAAAALSQFGFPLRVLGIDVGDHGMQPGFQPRPGDGAGIPGQARVIGDRIGFERIYSSGLPDVVLEASDVRRTFTVDRAGGPVEDLAPHLDGWVHHVAPSPTDPDQSAFVHTDLPGPYTFRVGMLTGGRPHFPSYPDEVTRFGSEPVWAADGSTVVSVGVQGIRAGVLACERDGKRWDWVVPAAGLHRSPVPLSDGGVLSIWQDLDAPPAVVHTTEQGSRQWAALDEPPDWSPSVLLRGTRWRSGQEALEGRIATPKGSGPFPTIIDVHGGPDDMPQEASLSSYAVPLTDWVDAGFAVFAPDYRESGILGLAAKRAASRMEPGQRASHNDVIAGTDHLIETGIADPNRLFLFGFSMVRPRRRPHHRPRPPDPRRCLLGPRRSRPPIHRQRDPAPTTRRIADRGAPGVGPDQPAAPGRTNPAPGTDHELGRARQHSETVTCQMARIVANLAAPQLPG